MGRAADWWLVLVGTMAVTGCRPRDEAGTGGGPAGAAAPDSPPPAVAPAEVAAPAPSPVTPAAPTAAVEVPAGGAAGWVDCRPSAAGEWKLVAGEQGGWDEGAGMVKIPTGFDLAGLRWSGAAPSAPFEVELEARRIDGYDFFCGLTVPTRSDKECVSLIIGGWGGSLVGISSLNEMDASENETGSSRNFESGRWYKIRLRFADEQLAAWIDGEQVIEVSTLNRRLSLRPGPIEACAPFGLATWNTAAEVRGVRWRRVGAE